MKILSIDALPDEPVSHNPRILKRVMIRNGQLPHLTQFAQARFRPGQVAAAHTHHDMYEIFFVESGRGQITINGQPHRLATGMCVVVEPGEEHEVANPGETDLVLTYMGLKAK